MRARIRTRPRLTGSHREIIDRQVKGASLRVLISPGREGIGGAVFTSQPEEHDFRAIVQLQAEPIPSGLIRFELMREKLMIHPTGALDRESFAVDDDGATGKEARQGNI